MNRELFHNKPEPTKPPEWWNDEEEYEVVN